MKSISQQVIQFLFKIFIYLFRIRLLGFDGRRGEKRQTQPATRHTSNSLDRRRLLLLVESRLESHDTLL